MLVRFHTLTALRRNRPQFQSVVAGFPCRFSPRASIKMSLCVRAGEANVVPFECGSKTNPPRVSVVKFWIQNRVKRDCIGSSPRTVVLIGKRSQFPGDVRKIVRTVYG